MFSVVQVVNIHKPRKVAIVLLNYVYGLILLLDLVRKGNVKKNGEVKIVWQRKILFIADNILNKVFLYIQIRYKNVNWKGGGVYSYIHDQPDGFLFKFINLNLI